jgi:rhodanese-related sulfurtransferase
MPDPEITPEAYQALLRQHAEARAAGNTTAPAPPLLLDVREPWEIATASLPGAVAIPMNEIPARAHTELDPDQPIIVLCHHGARSLSVTMWLRNQGFDHVQSLAGGIDEWSRTIDPTIPRY